MKALAFLIGLALVGGSTQAEVTRQQIASGGKTRTYYLFVPPKANPGPVPLIVLLHGAGGRGGPLAEIWKGLATREGVILAAPDSIDINTWLTPQDGPDFLVDVAEAVKHTHAVDPRRVYLFGHSAGSLFALTIGLLESRYFAAVAAHAGAFRDARRVPYLDVAQRKIPIAIFLGTDDDRFTIDDARMTKRAYESAGFPCQLTEIPHHGHAYTPAEDLNRMVWSFLSRQVLPSDPVIDRYTIR